jgi:hypothetical protein
MTAASFFPRSIDRRRAVDKLLARVGADAEIKPGELPYLMTDDEFEVFKLAPELFRKREATP